ncbi:MAG: hypothetical protein ACTSP4_10405, partial [Candidatus Hodarchaeales archaeon]
ATENCGNGDSLIIITCCICQALTSADLGKTSEQPLRNIFFALKDELVILNNRNRALKLSYYSSC